MEISKSIELEEIFRSGTVCRLGLCMNGIPYVVPMCYGYADGCLYFHTAKEGLKLDFIKSSGFACFEIETAVSVKPASQAVRWGMNYRCIIGHGNLEEVVDSGSKLEAMIILMKHYSGTGDWAIPQKQIDNVMILKLTITELTGKKSG